MTVKPGDYMPKLVEYGIMKITAVCVVDGTSQSWFAEDDFQVIKPILTVEVRAELQTLENEFMLSELNVSFAWVILHGFTGYFQVAPNLRAQQKGTVTFSFRNPLNAKLTQSSIRYEGPGFTRCGTIPLKYAPSTNFHSPWFCSPNPISFVFNL